MTSQYNPIQNPNSVVSALLLHLQGKDIREAQDFLSLLGVQPEDLREGYAFRDEDIIPDCSDEDYTVCEVFASEEKSEQGHPRTWVQAVYRPELDDIPTFLWYTLSIERKGGLSFTIDYKYGRIETTAY